MKGLCLEYKCRIMECGIKYVIWILFSSSDDHRIFLDLVLARLFCQHFL